MKTKTKALSTFGAVTVFLSLVALPVNATEDSATPLEVSVDEKKVVVDGVPGGIATRTTTMQAKVVAIDYDTRSLSLEDGKGNRKTITVGPEVQNFKQIQQGDNVSIEYVEEQIVYLSDEDKHVEESAAVAAAAAPDGEAPGAQAVQVIELVATVTAVDLEKHSVTLSFSNGTEVEQDVRPDVEILESHVGRQVVVQHTTAIAISIDK